MVVDRLLVRSASSIPLSCVPLLVGLLAASQFTNHTGVRTRCICQAPVPATSGAVIHPRHLATDERDRVRDQERHGARRLRRVGIPIQRLGGVERQRAGLASARDSLVQPAVMPCTLLDTYFSECSGNVTLDFARVLVPVTRMSLIDHKPAHFSAQFPPHAPAASGPRRSRPGRSTCTPGRPGPLAETPCSRS